MTPQAYNTWDLLNLSEGCDLECKAAQGRDGRGELPEDVWKSYSAMANADGGIILLGVREKPQGQFQALGLTEIERVRKALWDNLHNRKQINCNLLSESDVTPIVVEGKAVLQITVPRASRLNRPVYIGSNPFGGTYIRRHEGDYAADDETVRRLLAERVEESRDERVLKGFDFADLDMDTVLAYRNRFAAVKPGHVWTDLDVPTFLERIGAYGKNREEGYRGLRLAGLLMFGRAEVIRDELPNYMVDYQERPEAKTEKRWIDRVVPDGTWSGNLYDFFRRVYQKLTADVKVPFQLHDGQRIDDTPVHEAFREALVNTLIHADYSGRVSVLVVKRPDMCGFRNPGRMRTPLDLALQGGNSDCRNRRLQTMFQLVGYGDHAGSGLPKIYRNWASQHWRSPVLYELPEPEQTLIELRMSSLLPEQAIAELASRIDGFRELDEISRLALVTAQVEGWVSHGRLKQVSTDHPADLTKRLGALVRSGYLVSAGAGRGMVYRLPWQPPAHLAEEFEDLTRQPEIPKPPELESKPPELESKPPELESKPPEYEQIQDLALITVEEQHRLRTLAEPVSTRKRVPAELLQTTILNLCHESFLGLRVLAELLHRDADDLRKRTLTPMVERGALRTAFNASQHPKQAYTAVNTIK